MPKLSKPKIYLETSVISAYFDFWQDAPLQKKWTRIFWRSALPKYNIVISDIVRSEILAFTSDKWKDKVLKKVNNFKILAVNHDVEKLAQAYMHHGIVPKSKKEDALHLAVCLHYKLDYLITWNKKHIVRDYKIKQILEFNSQRGLAGPVILNPLMFLEIIL